MKYKIFIEDSLCKRGRHLGCAKNCVIHCTHLKITVLCVCIRRSHILYDLYTEIGQYQFRLPIKNMYVLQHVPKDDLSQTRPMLRPYLKPHCCQYLCPLNLTHFTQLCLYGIKAHSKLYSYFSLSLSLRFSAINGIQR